MADMYNQGLVVYSDRWETENGFLWKFFPLLRAKVGYHIRSYIRAREITKTIERFAQADRIPLFSQVELETQNRCNAGCAFCPVNRNAPQREYARMSEELYSSIIDQLAKLRFKRSLSLHSNNEPLLDKRLPDFAKEAHQKLPKARIKMFTNGSLLTLDLFRALLPSFDRIFINNYNNLPIMHPQIQEIHDYCLTPEGRKFITGKSVVIQYRNPGVVLSSRAGNAPNRKPPKRPPTFKCPYPYRQFIIRPDGKVSLCCNDALGEMTLGDLSTQPILDVWKGSAYDKIRKTMATQGRKGIPLCSLCDFLP